MSLIALKFVWAALVTLLLVVLMWFFAEIRLAPVKVRRLAGWILGVALVIGLAALAAPIVGGLWWWTFDE